MEVKFKLDWNKPSIIVLLILLGLFTFAPLWRGCLNWYDYFDVRADKALLNHDDYDKKRKELFQAEMDAKIRAAKEAKE